MRHHQFSRRQGTWSGGTGFPARGALTPRIFKGLGDDDGTGEQRPRCILSQGGRQLAARCLWRDGCREGQAAADDHRATAVDGLVARDRSAHKHVDLGRSKRSRCVEERAPRIASKHEWRPACRPTSRGALSRLCSSSTEDGTRSKRMVAAPSTYRKRFGRRRESHEKGVKSLPMMSVRFHL